MAIAIHIARTAFLAISKKTGQPVKKGDPTTTINDTLQTEHKHVVLPDPVSAPNSANYPTVDAYLKLEAAAGYVVQHIDQNLVITYSAHDINIA
jgi:hypothetical protein